MVTKLFEKWSQKIFLLAAAAGEKTLAHSELKRSLIGAFIRALSLVYVSRLLLKMFYKLREWFGQ